MLRWQRRAFDAASCESWATGVMAEVSANQAYPSSSCASRGYPSSPTRCSWGTLHHKSGGAQFTAALRHAKACVFRGGFCCRES